MQNSEMREEDYWLDLARCRLADAERRMLTQCHTLLVAEGFAGFPGDSSPSGGPS